MVAPVAAAKPDGAAGLVDASGSDGCLLLTIGAPPSPPPSPGYADGEFDDPSAFTTPGPPSRLSHSRMSAAGSARKLAARQQEVAATNRSCRTIIIGFEILLLFAAFTLAIAGCCGLSTQPWLLRSTSWTSGTLEHRVNTTFDAHYDIRPAIELRLRSNFYGFCVDVSGVPDYLPAPTEDSVGSSVPANVRMAVDAILLGKVRELASTCYSWNTGNGCVYEELKPTISAFMVLGLLAVAIKLAMPLVRVYFWSPVSRWANVGCGFCAWMLLLICWGMYENQFQLALVNGKDFLTFSHSEAEFFTAVEVEVQTFGHGPGFGATVAAWVFIMISIGISVFLPGDVTSSVSV